MSITPRQPIPSFIPESAPFTAEQRTWLNGLFAPGCLVSKLVSRRCRRPMSPLSCPGPDPERPGGTGEEADDGAPWHDPAMPLADRMKLSDGRPLQRRLMAAMAQQDCGQCGYNCNDYSTALFGKAEKRLNLCVPGGKETARMLRQLYQELEEDTRR